MPVDPDVVDMTGDVQEVRGAAAALVRQAEELADDYRRVKKELRTKLDAVEALAGVRSKSSSSGK